MTARGVGSERRGSCSEAAHPERWNGTVGSIDDPSASHATFIRALPFWLAREISRLAQPSRGLTPGRPATSDWSEPSVREGSPFPKPCVLVGEPPARGLKTKATSDEDHCVGIDGRPAGPRKLRHSNSGVAGTMTQLQL